VTITGDFKALGHNKVYLQIFGKVRPNLAAPGNPYGEDYGIVSLGISNPVRNSVHSDQDVFIRNAIFNPAAGGRTTIELNARQDGVIKAQVFTIDGLPVKTLYEGPVTAAMPHLIEWDGRNGAGDILATGVYLLRVDGAGIDRALKKLVVVK
jgi:hypothetical protein